MWIVIVYAVFRQELDWDTAATVAIDWFPVQSVWQVSITKFKLKLAVAVELQNFPRATKENIIIVQHSLFGLQDGIGLSTSCVMCLSLRCTSRNRCQVNKEIGLPVCVCGSMHFSPHYITLTNIPLESQTIYNYSHMVLPWWEHKTIPNCVYKQWETNYIYFWPNLSIRQTGGILCS